MIKNSCHVIVYDAEQKLNITKIHQNTVKNGIRTHAHNCGSEPKSDALDHSAIST